MKTGKSLMELASQIQDVQKNSKDFIVPTSRLAMKIATPTVETPAVDLNEIVDETVRVHNEKLKEVAEKKQARPVLTFTNGDEKNFDLNSWSHQQLATYTDIPKQYYDRIMDQNPELLAKNVNHGLVIKAMNRDRSNRPESRMLRTYRGSLRGFVSSSYRRLDCFDLLETVLPVLQKNQFEVLSSELTDRRMYLMVTTPRITSMVKVGDAVQYGLTISSSDVGAGSVRVEPLIYRLICRNGAISASAIRKMHIGRNQAGDDITELLTEETQDLSDRAFWAEVHDVVVASMQKDFFEKEVEKLRAAAGDQIQNYDIPEVVELASKNVGVTRKDVKESIVAYLANGADGAGLTRWGLSNAFTHAANQDFVTYDDAVELQRAGSKIIELNKSAWRSIAAA